MSNGPKSPFYGGVYLAMVRLTFCEMAVSQPAAIGQPISHLTKCQTNPNSDPRVRQADILWDHQSSKQPASQLQLASQPAIWQAVNLSLSQILGGVHLFTSIHKWHFVRCPTSQPGAVGQPTSHLTKCQPDPQSYWGFIWLNVNLTQSLT